MSGRSAAQHVSDLIYDRLGTQGLSARMLLTVHDELVLEAPNEERAQVEALVRDTMENALSLSVPLVVEVGWGESWGQAH